MSGIMIEIDLLKNLNHQNIVKYLGSYKSKSHLYIILEFAENGALSNSVKPTRFGAFPENLVGLYISQVSLSVMLDVKSGEKEKSPPPLLTLFVCFFA